MKKFLTAIGEWFKNTFTRENVVGFFVGFWSDLKSLWVLIKSTTASQRTRWIIVGAVLIVFNLTTWGAMTCGAVSRAKDKAVAKYERILGKKNEKELKKHKLTVEKINKI